MQFRRTIGAGGSDMEPKTKAPRSGWATVAGIAAFAAVLVLGGPLMYLGLSHTLFKTTTFPGNMPPERFLVAYRELTDSGAPGPAKMDWWKAIEEQRRNGRRLTFLVPPPAAMQSYSILDDRGASQIIETRYRNTHGAWARYEARSDHIVPISHRTDGSPFFLMLPILALFVAAFWVGNRVERVVRTRMAR
jgi:hypothetical protein